MTKDLYVVFNGMFLFNWKTNPKQLEVYVPQHGSTHYNFVAQDLDLNGKREPLQDCDDFTVHPLKPTREKRFDIASNLAIHGRYYNINTDTKPYAKFTLPWPDEVYTPESYLVWKDKYVGGTDPNATLSPDVPNGVEEHPSGNKQTAIAVSEVLVLKYSNVEPAWLSYGGGKIHAIESGPVQLLGIFASMAVAHVGHPHDDAFNKLLVHVETGNPPEYRPSARPQDLGQKAPVPKAGTSPSPDIPGIWLRSTEFALLRSGEMNVMTSSGMGSCDNGNRCEDC